MQLAFDKASVREKDRDGRLHVKITPISKANVCPYLGKEIPNWQGLGLDPNKTYMLFRDPEELSKAAETFNSLPILSRHIPVSANKPEKELVIGATGTDAKFDDPYLYNSMVFWDAKEIAKIESGEKVELSSSYYYQVDMTAGVHGGQPYDGRMRDIVGNHVALVKDGRAGPDVLVHDEKPAEIAMPESVMERLKPHLSQDADLEEIKKILVENRAGEKKDHAAQDNEDDKKAKDSEKEIDKAKDTESKKADDEDDDEEKAKDSNTENEANKQDKAMDSKLIIAQAVEQAKREAAEQVRRELKSIEQARSDVKPLVGDVAMDSAEEIYKFALSNAGVDIKGVDSSAYPAMVRFVAENKTKAKPKLAMDAAHADSFSKMFPDAVQIKGGL